MVCKWCLKNDYILLISILFFDIFRQLMIFEKDFRESCRFSSIQSGIQYKPPLTVENFDPSKKYKKWQEIVLPDVLRDCSLFKSLRISWLFRFDASNNCYYMYIGLAIGLINFCYITVLFFRIAIGFYCILFAQILFE